MAIVDLTGTTWTLGNTLYTYPGGTYPFKTYNINVTTETPIVNAWDSSQSKDTFTDIAVGYNSGPEENEIRLDYQESSSVYMMATGNDTKSLPDPWRSYYNQSFTVTGGTDATNTTLIDWFEHNATIYVPPSIDVTVTYMGDDIVEMTDSGIKTLKTQGKYLEDDIAIKYIKSGGGISATTVTFGEYSQAIVPSGGGIAAYVDGDGVAQIVTNGGWGIGVTDNVLMMSGSILFIYQNMDFDMGGTWNNSYITGMTMKYSGSQVLGARVTVYYRVYQVD